MFEAFNARAVISALFTAALAACSSEPDVMAPQSRWWSAEGLSIGQLQSEVTLELMLQGYNVTSPVRRERKACVRPDNERSAGPCSVELVRYAALGGRSASVEYTTSKSGRVLTAVAFYLPSASDAGTRTIQAYREKFGPPVKSLQGVSWCVYARSVDCTPSYNNPDEKLSIVRTPSGPLLITLSSGTVLRDIWQRDAATGPS